MKLLIPVIIFSVFAAGCGEIRTDAQIRASNTGAVNTRPQSTPTPTKTAALQLSKVDFKNFTFPGFAVGTTEKPFTLKNGFSEDPNVFPKYTLRRTYYFDLTGDRQDEAVSHIMVEGCQMGCSRSNLFYIHTADGNEPRLLWKIATGGDVLGGLKSVNFQIDQVLIEVFGNCTVENEVIKPEVDLQKNAKLKTTNYTRFVFTNSGGGYTQTAREVLPLVANIDFLEYRPQISFGKQQ